MEKDKRHVSFKEKLKIKIRIGSEMADNVIALLEEFGAGRIRLTRSNIRETLVIPTRKIS